jgi:hypothetical protein
MTGKAVEKHGGKGRFSGNEPGQMVTGPEREFDEATRN